MMDQIILIREELRKKINEELDKLESTTDVTDVIKEIDEIRKVLDDLKLRLLKLRAQQLESEEIDDDLYEELDKISEDILKNPEKSLTAEDAVKELLSS
jgi:ribosomal protein L29